MPADEKPMTIGDLARSGRHLIAECIDCGHSRKMPAGKIAVAPGTIVGDVGKKMKCSRCGLRKILTRPESVRDARKGIER